MADEVKADEVELAAASTQVAADYGSTTLRPQRSKAGNSLYTILQAVREQCEEDETNLERIMNDEQSRDNSHDPKPGCCVCEWEVTKDKEPFLRCSQEKCQAVVHISCTSYTVRGAERAKLQCPTCKANKMWCLHC